MQGFCEPFKNKKITLLGLGLLGRGVGDAEFLAKCGAEIVAVDRKSESELAASVAKLKHYPNIIFHLGKSEPEDFSARGGSASGGTDMVIKAAGVPLHSPEIAAARAAGVPVYMSTALFAKYAREAGAKIVGITGTRGKSTVTQMIHHSLISAFAKASADRRAHLGGNVRGKSTLAMLPEIKAGDICVLELDSWQLQGFGDLNISPHIAVFTNLMPDHQNYYPSMEAYFADKANIFRFQKEGDSVFVGKSLLPKIQSGLVPPPIPSDWKLHVIGEHNRENASFAAAALKSLGLSEAEIRSGLESFEAVEGRLQFVRESRGVKIYNDNNATTPEATIAALKALSPSLEPRASNLTLITGGSEKGLALGELVSEIKKTVSHLLVLTHPHYKGSERLMGELESAGIAFETAERLSEAVQKGMNGRNGDVLLFSPAFASFGMFKNEYERNDEFLAAIKTIQ